MTRPKKKTLQERALALATEELRRLEEDQASTPASGTIKAADLAKLVEVIRDLQPAQAPPQREDQDYSRLSPDELRLLHNLMTKARGGSPMFFIPPAAARASAFAATVPVSAVPTTNPPYKIEALPADEVPLVIAAFERGDSARTIAKRLGCTERQVLHTLKSAGIGT